VTQKVLETFDVDMRISCQEPDPIGTDFAFMNIVHDPLLIEVTDVRPGDLVADYAGGAGPDVIIVEMFSDRVGIAIGYGSAGLVEIGMTPEPLVEIHPQLAERLGIHDGEWVTVESRRGNCTLKVQVVKTIRPDTIFIPYHWAGPKSANQLTISAQDPISKIPEYKVCAVRVRKADRAPEYSEAREVQQ